MNGDQPLDIESVIADLEAKKAAIDNAIQALRALYPAGADGAALSAIAGVVAKSVEPDKIPSDAFFGMRSIGDAAKKYLNLVKRKQTTKQIGEALERGGFPHQSKTFYSTVYTALQRLEEQEGGDIARIGSEWAIASWYPAHAKRSKSATEKTQESAREAATRLRQLPRGKRKKALRKIAAALKQFPAVAETKESGG
jgi:hypothetical protein